MGKEGKSEEVEEVCGFRAKGCFKQCLYPVSQEEIPHDEGGTQSNEGRGGEEVREISQRRPTYPCCYLRLAPTPSLFAEPPSLHGEGDVVRSLARRKTAAAK